jgi:hypothetical protein
MGELLIVLIIILLMCSVVYKDMSAICIVLPVGFVFFNCMNHLSRKKNSEIKIVPVEQPPAEPFDDGNTKKIVEKNREAINAVYGDQPLNPIDFGVSKFNQRIGDRDRKAIIAQIKGRRNPTYEPYYRRELEDQATVRWWDNEDVMVRTINENQRQTIPM